MKVVIIHAGPHKTGSTYIQKNLIKNRELLKKHSIKYPAVYFFALGQHLLLNSLNGHDKAEDIRSVITGECIQEDYCIISSENLSSLNGRGVKKCSEVFHEYEVRVVFYVRRPSEKLRSLWQEGVKHGNFFTLERFFVDNVRNANSNSYINPSSFLMDFKNNFSLDTLSLIDYDTASADNSVMKNFWLAAGLDQYIKDNGEYVNAMMPVEEIEFLRLLNYYAFTDGLLIKENVREVFMQNIDYFEGYLSHFRQEIEAYKEKLPIGNWHIDHMVKNIMERDWKKYFVNEISIPQLKHVEHINNNWVLNTKATAVVQEAYKKMKKKIKDHDTAKSY